MEVLNIGELAFSSSLGGFSRRESVDVPSAQVLSLGNACKASRDGLVGTPACKAWLDGKVEKVTLNAEALQTVAENQMPLIDAFKRELDHTANGSGYWATLGNDIKGNTYRAEALGTHPNNGEASVRMISDSVVTDPSGGKYGRRLIYKLTRIITPREGQPDAVTFSFSLQMLNLDPTTLSAGNGVEITAPILFPSESAQLGQVHLSAGTTL